MKRTVKKMLWNRKFLKARGYARITAVREMKIGRVLPLLLTLSQADWKHHHSDDRSEHVLHRKYFACTHTVWMQVNIRAPAWNDIQRRTGCGGLSTRTTPLLLRWGAHHYWQRASSSEHRVVSSYVPLIVLLKVIWIVGHCISSGCLMMWTAATSIPSKKCRCGDRG